MRYDEDYNLSTNDHSAEYAGLPVVDPFSPPTPLPEGPIAVRLGAEELNPDVDRESRGEFWDHVDPATVQAVVTVHNPDGYALFLERNAHRLPAVRAIFLGDLQWEECQISWIEHGDITPLLEAYPLLERLDVRGSEGLELRPIRHEALRSLRFESGGLPAEVVRAVGASELPALEYLEMWLGVTDYGGDATVEDMAGILSGENLPALKHLGLQNSEIQDEIAAAVASAPIVARLESLSLSMGALSDTGAEALLSSRALTNLRRLDLRHHFIGEDLCDRLSKALVPAGVEVLLDDREEPDGDGELYVAVDE